MEMYYVVAYLNHNLGDDMFVQTLVRRYPRETFYFCNSSEEIEAFYLEKNIKKINTIVYQTKKAIYKIFGFPKGGITSFWKEKRADAVIRIGGSIFIEREGWEERKQKKINKNVFIIGANYGPAETEKFKKYVKSDIKLVNDCCFRDQLSYCLFEDCGNVRYAPDVLFGYADYPKIIKGNGVGISVVNLYNHKHIRQYKEEYERCIAEFCDICISKGVKVTMFSFCNNENDLDVIKNILNKVSFPEKILIESYSGNIEIFLEKFNQCEYILATRFHAMIIGWCLKKKVYPIIYSIKQENVLDDISYNASVWKIGSNEKITGELLFENLKECICPDIDNLQTQATNQFAALDSFIKRMKND